MPDAILHGSTGQKRQTFASGATLAAILSTAGHGPDRPCGGAGNCGRCLVRAKGALSPFEQTEQAALNPGELAGGWRLACQARARGPVEVWLPDEAEMPRIWGAAPSTSAAPKACRSKRSEESCASGTQAAAFDAGTCYGLAVDIGTTTLAMQLLAPGGATASYTCKNPQTCFGADVLTRIGHALAGGAGALAQAVRSGITKGMAALAQQLCIETSAIDTIVVTGNTAMLHLLCGHNPETLSHAPFTADRLYGEWMPARPLFPAVAADARLYLPRCISAFVGADISTAILAAGLCRRRETALLVDIGTNGEMALWHNGHLYCCATAAGPAFEGAGISCGVYAVSGAIDKVWRQNSQLCTGTITEAPATGLCGSGIIDALALMLACGAVDETGAFAKTGHLLEQRVTQYKGRPALQLAENVFFTDEDVRKVQLAKGAVRAGMETLLQHAGVPAQSVTQLYIAGGFGKSLNLHSAVQIGLIPKELQSRAVPLGNAALAGAVMLLQNQNLPAETGALARAAETLDLATSRVFQDAYVEHMMFGG